METLYGLIGYPLTHSFSQKYFTEKFSRENISDCRYLNFPMPDITELPALLRLHPGLKGLNVTIPHKTAVMSFLQEVDEEAKAIGAVNCISIEEGKLTGYNTDATGFRQSIKPFLESQHERALILGTGGASRAVYHVLKQIGIDCYFVTRNKSTSSHTQSFSYEELNEHIMHAFRLIVNCSPVGTFPDTESCPPLPYQHLGSSHLLYDLVYNPPETMFMKEGRRYGATAINGYSMLQLQAEAAWQIWQRHK
jgi:shikimate dehydrogenase